MEALLHRHDWLNHWPLVIESSHPQKERIRGFPPERQDPWPQHPAILVSDLSHVHLPNPCLSLSPSLKRRRELVCKGSTALPRWNPLQWRMDDYIFDCRNLH